MLLWTLQIYGLSNRHVFGWFVLLCTDYVSCAAENKRHCYCFLQYFIDKKFLDKKFLPVKGLKFTKFLLIKRLKLLVLSEMNVNTHTHTHTHTHTQRERERERLKRWPLQFHTSLGDCCLILLSLRRQCYETSSCIFLVLFGLVQTSWKCSLSSKIPMSSVPASYDCYI